MEDIVSTVPLMTTFVDRVAYLTIVLRWKGSGRFCLDDRLPKSNPPSYCRLNSVGVLLCLSR